MHANRSVLHVQKQSKVRRATIATDSYPASRKVKVQLQKAKVICAFHFSCPFPFGELASMNSTHSRVNRRA